MIVKMKFINISGPRNDIDRVTDLYLSKYEIQLESALSELKTVNNLRPFVEINPYRDALAQAEQLTALLEDPEKVKPDEKLGLDSMFEVIRNTSADYQSMQDKKEKLKKKIEDLHQKQQVIAPFRPLDCNLSEVLNYKYIAYRFGRIAVEYYYKMKKYLIEEMDAIFVEGERDESYVYGAYFVSPGGAPKADALFRTLHFERITLNNEYEGTPTDAYQKLQRQINKQNNEIAARWRPGWTIMRKISTFYADGCPKTMWQSFKKILPMMTRSLSWWRKTEAPTSAHRRQSSKIRRSSSPLRCMYRCTGCRLTTRWIPPYLWA